MFNSYEGAYWSAIGSLLRVGAYWEKGGTIHCSDFNCLCHKFDISHLFLISIPTGETWHSY